tara:strand:- start:2144 stop:2824 length:681 start_codon:yes stop_codon:yes gene_type:complete
MQSFEGYSFEKSRKDITYFLNKAYPNGLGCEVGVCRGEFSKHLLDNWNCRELYLVDLWEEHDDYKEDFHDQNGNFEKMKNNVKDHGERVKVFKGYSNKIVNNFDDEIFDFIYIDANHSYEACKEDIQLYWKKLKKGGILMGDDYTLTPVEPMDFNNGNSEPIIFGVNQAVNEFADEHKKIISLQYTGDWLYSSSSKPCDDLLTEMPNGCIQMRSQMMYSRNFVIQK